MTKLTLFTKVSISCLKILIRFRCLEQELELSKSRCLLSQLETEGCLKGKWISERLINAALRIACSKQNCDFQTCLLAQCRFCPARDPSVQILYDRCRAHWVCTALLNNVVYYCDSLGLSISAEVALQVSQLYSQYFNCQNFPIHVLNVQRQINGSDCGPFAVAFAFHFANGQLPESVRFDVEKMRIHLIYCIQNSISLPFPQVSDKKWDISKMN